MYALNAKTGNRIWSYTTSGTVESSPAVGKNLLYIGSDDGYIYALNAVTGDRVWSYKTGDKINSSPTLADDVVYVGSCDNNVYALDAASGSKIWSYATGSPVESFPSIANGVLYIGSGDNNIYAFGSITVAQPSPPLPSVSPTISLSTPLPNNEVFPFVLIATIIIAIIPTHMIFH